MKKVSVIILNWNGEQLLKQFLPSVVKYTPVEIADVVVADNGSTDNSLVLLKTEFPSVHIIELEKNYGFADGYNQAIAVVKTPYVVLLNSDVEVTQDWLLPLVEEVEQQADVVAVQPKILSWRDKTSFEYAGACGGYMDKYGYPFCRGRLLHVLEIDKGQYNSPADVLWTSGACMLVRRDVYVKVGGLDATFFAHQEEIDLCWLMRCRGYRLRCIPSSVVFHVGGGTLEPENPRKTFLNFRNNLLMLYKNIPEYALRRVMLSRRILDYIAAAKFLVSGYPSNAKAVYEARREFYRIKYRYE
ncbi:MAG: glycosyltransferase family 2 protein, partial [Parabacteroides sp.]|nr:glycosyltransferase family 2 protein [Parabacteroides sp.]